MKVVDYLDSECAQYEISEHRAVFTAQRIAQEEHVPGMNVAKSVIVKADGQNWMCVLPACCKIDFDALAFVLEADLLGLIDEVELEELFPDCQIGAEPPFGSFYGLPTVMDGRLENDEFIVFQGGTHERSIRMSMADYLRIEQPRIFSFSYHI